MFSTPISFNDFDSALGIVATTIEPVLQNIILNAETLFGNHPSLIQEITHYATFDGGKRLRTFFVLVAGEICGAGINDDLYQPLARVATAIELVHSSTCIMDDLPIMDNDVERRGKPTAWKKFNSGSALMASSVMLALATDILLNPKTHPDPEVRIELVRLLNWGTNYVQQSQSDEIYLRDNFSFLLPEMQRRVIYDVMMGKSGALFSTALGMGAILAGGNAEQVNALRLYGLDAGAGFQMKDDLLDVEGDTSLFGNRLNRDAEANTINTLTICSVDEVRQWARECYNHAVSHLINFFPETSVRILNEAASFMTITRLK